MFNVNIFIIIQRFWIIQIKRGYYNNDEGKVVLYGNTAYGIISKDGKRRYDFGNVSKETETNLLKIYHQQYTEITTINEHLNE